MYAIRSYYVADDPFVGIDAIHQLAAGVNTARTGRENLQQLEFDGGQIEIDATQRGVVAGFIKSQASYNFV